MSFRRTQMFCMGRVFLHDLAVLADHEHYPLNKAMVDGERPRPRHKSASCRATELWIGEARAQLCPATPFANLA